MNNVLGFCDVCHPAPTRTGENIKNAPYPYPVTVVMEPLTDTMTIDRSYCKAHLKVSS